jgi:phage portal protein BeeE
VPPHMIGDLEHATFSNIEEQSLEFVTYSLQPWLARIESAISRSLLTPEEKKIYYARFNVDGPFFAATMRAVCRDMRLASVTVFCV